MQSKKKSNQKKPGMPPTNLKKCKKQQIEDNNKITSGRSTNQTDTAATNIAGEILGPTPFNNSTVGMPDLATQSSSSGGSTNGSSERPTQPTTSEETMPVPTDNY